MNNPDTEIIFPLRVTPFLADTLDAEWRGLTERITSSEADIMDQLGFVLTMAKLAGCVSCNSDSFRAIRGCTQCAIQTMKRQRIKGVDLISLFEQNRLEVEEFSLNRRYDKENREILGIIGLKEENYE